MKAKAFIKDLEEGFEESDEELAKLASVSSFCVRFLPSFVLHSVSCECLLSSCSSLKIFFVVLWKHKNHLQISKIYVRSLYFSFPPYDPSSIPIKSSFGYLYSRSDAAEIVLNP